MVGSTCGAMASSCGRHDSYSQNGEMCLEALCPYSLQPLAACPPACHVGLFARQCQNPHSPTTGGLAGSARLNSLYSVLRKHVHTYFLYGCWSCNGSQVMIRGAPPPARFQSVGGAVSGGNSPSCQVVLPPADKRGQIW